MVVTPSSWPRDRLPSLDTSPDNFCDSTHSFLPHSFQLLYTHILFSATYSTSYRSEMLHNISSYITFQHKNETTLGYNQRINSKLDDCWSAAWSGLSHSHGKPKKLRQNPATVGSWARRTLRDVTRNATQHTTLRCCMKLSLLWYSVQHKIWHPHEMYSELHISRTNLWTLVAKPSYKIWYGKRDIQDCYDTVLH